LPEDVASTLRQSTTFERLLIASSPHGDSAPLPLPSAQPRTTSAQTKTEAEESKGHDDAEAEASEPSARVGSDKSSAGALSINMEHISHSAAMSQVAVLEEDTVHDPTLFPPGTPSYCVRACFV
jgi:hypothetical protein